MAREWIEALDKRRRASKTKRLHVDGQPTNKFSCDATIGPMHYKDAGGDFQDINADLLPSTRSIVGFGNPAYEMLENEYEMFVLGELNSGVPLVRYVSKNTDYWVQFAAHNLVWTNDLDQIDFIATPATTTTEVSDAEAKWPDAYGAGLDLRYIAGHGRMAKWLDIASPLPAPAQYVIDGGNPVIEFAEILEFHGGLEVYVNGQEWNKKDDVSTAAEIEFRSPDGQVQFVFPVAIGFHEGIAPDTSVVGELHLKKQGNKLYVTARFPWPWLQSATYPVRLDTDVDKQVATGADDASRFLADSFTADQEYGWWGNIEGLEGCKQFYRWTGVSIEGTIGVAHMTVYPLLDDAGLLTNVYGVDEDNPAAPTTYQEFDADVLTSAVVECDGALGGIDNWYNGPSLVSIFQELADTYTISNDAVMVQVNDDGSALNDRAEVAHYEQPGNTYGPKLHIEYEAAAAGVPQQMMHYMRMRKE